MKITGREVRAIGWMMIKQIPANSCRRCVNCRAVCGHRYGTADEFRSTLCSVHSKTLSETTFTVGGRVLKKRTSILNRCNNATVRIREVPLVHASCDVLTLSRTSSRFYAINDLIAVGCVGNLLCGRPLIGRITTKLLYEVGRHLGSNQISPDCSP